MRYQTKKQAFILHTLRNGGSLIRKRGKRYEKKAKFGSLVCCPIRANKDFFLYLIVL
jgi:hypothetical protein